MRLPSRVAAVIVTLGVIALAGCSDDAESAESLSSTPTDATTTSTTSTTTTAPEPECPSAQRPLQILVANDDGVINPAIDVMVDLLGAIDGIELTIVAPAEERSGSSDRTTPGGAPFQEATTPGGHPAYSVDGFPADSVLVALDELGLDPDLVLSGVNPGQNVGPFAALSGTVGVGRTAIRRGYPALAVSAGIQFDQAQFEFAAGLARDWIVENCEALVDGTAQTDTVTSINVPACPPAQIGELQSVPRAAEIAEGVNVFESRCDLSDSAPADDVTALIAGYPAITQVPAEL